eukprot:14379818-Alexandrium_andersonii.AAC.1
MRGQGGGVARAHSPRWTAAKWSQTVGQYRLGSTIGKGHFGRVKLAEHVKTSEKAAHDHSSWQ